MKKRENCWYCGEPAFGWDHIQPKSRGGTECPANLVEACQSCNSTKGTKTLEEYRVYVSRREAGFPRSMTEEVRDWLNECGFLWPELASVTFWGEDATY